MAFLWIQYGYEYCTLLVPGSHTLNFSFSLLLKTKPVEEGGIEGRKQVTNSRTHEALVAFLCGATAADVFDRAVPWIIHHRNPTPSSRVERGRDPRKARCILSKSTRPRTHTSVVEREREGGRATAFLYEQYAFEKQTRVGASVHARCLKRTHRVQQRRDQQRCTTWSLEQARVR